MAFQIRREWENKIKINMQERQTKLQKKLSNINIREEPDDETVFIKEIY